MKVKGQAQAGYKTEVITRHNRFGGCIRAGCPNLKACTNNPKFSRCPINADCFDQETTIVKNTLLNSFLNKIADDLAGVANSLSLEILYLSVGTNTALTVGTETQLNAEIYRNAPVDLQRPSVGKVTAYGFLPPAVANGALREWGWIVGAATSTLGTGTAANRWLTSIDKTSEDTVSVQYSIIGANA